MTEGIQEKTNRSRVWTTIMELHRNGQQITRQRVIELSGLTYHIVDGHITNLIEREGTLRRVIDGVFEPIMPFAEPRAITVTDLPDGMMIVEIGDLLLTLSPVEVRMLAKRLQGDAQTAANLQMQHDVGFLTHEVQLRLMRQRQEQNGLIESLQAEIKALKKKGAPPDHPRMATQEPATSIRQGSLLS